MVTVTGEISTNWSALGMLYIVLDLFIYLFSALHAVLPGEIYRILPI